jgi:hypothetical protein
MKDILCTPCYPIIYQVFFCTGGDWEDEAHYLAFNFTDNVLGAIHEENALWDDIDEALNGCSDKVLLCM